MECQLKARVSQLKQWETELQNREQAIKKRQKQAEFELNRERRNIIERQGYFEALNKTPAYHTQGHSQSSYGPVEIPKTTSNNSLDHLSEWVEYWDTGTNRKFYFHKDSRHVAWRTPPRKLSKDEYSNLTDGELSNSINEEASTDTDIYEFLSYDNGSLANDESGEASLVSYSNNGVSDGVVSTVANEVESSQGTANDFIRSNNTSSEQKHSTATVINSDWEQLYDERYGEFYWYNSATGVSQWEYPQNDGES
jgi:hypothetical protein